MVQVYRCTSMDEKTTTQITMYYVSVCICLNGFIFYYATECGLHVLIAESHSTYEDHYFIRC